MNARLFPVIAAVGVLLFASTDAHAASGELTRSDLVPDPARLASFERQKAEHLKELALHRAECQTAIRRSNRDTKLPTALSCFRKDLLLQMAFLRQETAYMKQLTGVSAAAMTRTLSAITALSDAMATIVNAIDVDVYQSVEELTTAKRKLWERYITDHELALRQLHADRTAGWAQLMTLRLEQLRAQESWNAAAEAQLPQTAECLENLLALLYSFAQEKTYESIKEFEGQYQSSRANCVQSLRALTRLIRDPESPSTESGSGAVEAGSRN